jgi:serine/threonine-protein kinase
VQALGSAVTSAVVPPGEAGADPVPFDEAAWVGRTIDERYKVEMLLGQGGMGAVFLAEHVKLQKKVALKVILPQFAGNGEVAERFAREAMASAKLEHPHVASALDYGTLPEGGAYLVMQYARGPSLRGVLAGTAPERARERGWRYACEIGAQVADALSAAHAAGIVHRDLKPENVMLEPREDGGELVKVLDFGIARVVDEKAAQSGLTKLTRVGTIIGTPGYMAPEQALGETVDARADLYALGVILWEICAGRELFTETEVTALVTKQLTTEPPRIATLAPDVPPELDTLVARLLARDRNERPDKAGEVRETLKRLGLVASVERLSMSGQFQVSNTLPLGTQAPTGTTGGYAALGASQPGAAPGTFSGAGTPGVRALATLMSGPRLTLPAAVPVAPEARRAIDELLAKLPPPPLVYVLFAAVAFAGVMMLSLFAWMLTPSAAPVASVAPVPVAPATFVPPIPSGVDPRPPEERPDQAALYPPGIEPVAHAQPPIPTTVSADFETLLHDESRPARRAAADRLLAMPSDAMPSVVRLVATLEAETGCTERRDVVEQLETLGDPRVLPALERIDDSPRRGCGFLGSQDCYRCLRRPLSHALRSLRGE